MKIDPGFTSHWKTRRLLAACGPEAVLGLLALWGQAQIKRQWSGLDLNPARLALVMDYHGDPGELWRVMTDVNAPWLDAEDGGTWAIHGFEEHHAQVVHLWKLGKRGGRPKAAEPSPSTPPSPIHSLSLSLSPNGNHMETICKPNGNHMGQRTPSLEEVLAAAKMLSVSDERATIWFHEHESRPITPDGEWTDKGGRPVRNWRSALKAWDGKWTANEARNGSRGIQNSSNGTKKPATVWELKQRIETAEKEIGRIQGDQRNKLYGVMGQTRLKPEAAAKVKALRAQLEAMRSQLAGTEAAA